MKYEKNKFITIDLNIKEKFKLYKIIYTKVSSIFYKVSQSSKKEYKFLLKLIPYRNYNIKE